MTDNHNVKFNEPAQQEEILEPSQPAKKTPKKMALSMVILFLGIAGMLGLLLTQQQKTTEEIAGLKTQIATQQSIVENQEKILSATTTTLVEESFTTVAGNTTLPSAAAASQVLSFEGRTLGGETLNAAELQGQDVMIWFFAPW